MIKKISIVWVLVIIASASSRGQKYGELRGEVTDSLTNELIHADIIIKDSNDIKELEVISTHNGEYCIKDIPIGIYNIHTYEHNYKENEIRKIRIEMNRITYLNFKLCSKKVTKHSEYITNKPEYISKKPEYISNKNMDSCVCKKGQNYGVLKGKVTDFETGEAIPFANVIIKCGTPIRQTGGVSANFKGEYCLKSIKEGLYDIHASSLGYAENIIKGYSVKANAINYQNIQLKTRGVIRDTVTIMTYTKQLVDADNGSSGRLTKNELSKAPVRDITKLTNLTSSNKTNSNTNSNSNQLTNDNIQKIPPINITEQENNREYIGDVVAGKLTATEINDFGKWELWKDIEKTKLNEFQALWKISPIQRYTVQVKNKDDRPVIDANVLLKRVKGDIIWSARTDNTGKAELWADLFSQDKPGEKEIVLNYNNNSYTYNNPNLFKNGINVIKIPDECHVPDQVDIGFVVDATESMADEMRFLKSDILDIINKVKNNMPGTQLRLGSVFYRCYWNSCNGNSYVSVNSPLTTDIEKINNFINAHTAGDGGDEVVEEGFRVALDSLNWSIHAKARILFFMLDEQPLTDPDILQKMHDCIRRAAEKGIRVIPVIGSAETPLHAASMEYLMRCVALATNGTTVFLTDHSKIGDKHAKPTTDQYDVELLNNLLRRLIYQFSYVPNCNSNPDMEGISDTTYFTTSPIIAHEVIDTSKTYRVFKPKLVVKDYSYIPSRDSINKVNKTDTIINNKVNNQEEIQNNDNLIIKLYPNPTKGALTIELEGKAEEFYLIDFSGKIVQKYEAGSKQKMQIDISNCSAGIYFIKILDNLKWYYGKVILTH